MVHEIPPDLIGAVGKTGRVRFGCGPQQQCGGVYGTSGQCHISSGYFDLARRTSGVNAENAASDINQ